MEVAFVRLVLNGHIEGERAVAIANFRDVPHAAELTDESTLQFRLLAQLHLHPRRMDPPAPWTVVPGASGFAAGAVRSAIPTSLLVALILLGLAALAAAAPYPRKTVVPYVTRRVRARRHA